LIGKVVVFQHSMDNPWFISNLSFDKVHRKNLKIPMGLHRPGMNSGAPEGYAFPLPLVAPSC